MIALVKTKRTGDKQMINQDGEVEYCEAGLMIKFSSEDSRKPAHTVLIDHDSIKQLLK